MASTLSSRTLLHYRLVDKIGEGGMGVVWRAVDTHLDREVAIKVLPAQLAEDVERLARLEREAKLLASLSHPNICAVFGLEEASGTRFLVMELLSGEDLSQRLVRGGLSVEETLDVCGQIAGALEAAHDQGIVHRDLKPANVRVTNEGVVKVLDFGLARPGLGPSDPGDLSLSPTITAMTGSSGALLGTASYMSPEQARTQPVDRRTDLWSLGCVMYECLTGRRAFEGDSVSDSLAEILKSAPDWSALPDGTPPRLRELIERCLTKDPRDRQRDAGDVGLELRHIARLGGDASVETATYRPARERMTLVAVAAGALLAGALLGIGLWKASARPSSPTSSRVARFSISIPEGQLVKYWYLSPDGSHLAYRASADSAEAPDGSQRTLFVRRLDAYETRPVESSHGVYRAAFSPDGRWLAFLAHESPRSARVVLSKVPVDGSAPPLRLAEWTGDWNYDFVWLSEERLVTTSLEAVIHIAADGSGVQAAVDVESNHGEALFKSTVPLPDGRTVLCEALSTDEDGFHIDVALLDVETGQARTVIVDGSSPRWSPRGQLLFTRRDTLLAVPFDAGSLELTGSPRTITRGLGGGERYGGAWFDLSHDGTLVYQPGGVVGGNRRLAWIGLDGTVEDWSTETRSLGGLKASTDGRWIAVTIIGQTGDNDEVWVAGTGQPPLRRLFAEEGLDCFTGAISRSGRVAAFCGVMMKDVGGVLIRDARAGDGSEIVVGRVAGEFLDTLAFTADESRLIYIRWLGDKTDLFDVPLRPAGVGSRPERLLLKNVDEARLSPDGVWLAYVSDSSGRSQAYLRSYEPLGGLGPEIPITTEGASAVRWSPTEIEGRNRLFVKAAGGQFQSLTFDSDAIPPMPPSELHPELSERLRNADDYQPITDRWLAILRGDDERPPDELRVVLNWTANL